MWRTSMLSAAVVATIMIGSSTQLILGSIFGRAGPKFSQKVSSRTFPRERP